MALLSTIISIGAFLLSSSIARSLATYFLAFFGVSSAIPISFLLAQNRIYKKPLLKNFLYPMTFFFFLLIWATNLLAVFFIPIYMSLAKSS